MLDCIKYLFGEIKNLTSNGCKPIRLLSKIFVYQYMFKYYSDYNIVNFEKYQSNFFFLVIIIINIIIIVIVIIVIITIIIIILIVIIIFIIVVILIIVILILIMFSMLMLELSPWLSPAGRWPAPRSWTGRTGASPPRCGEMSSQSPGSW